jgi:hypothetical protein
MDRRRFLLTSLAGALAAPRAAEAQQARKVHHIGFLPAGASPAHRQQFDALREGLRELGYVEGKTIVISAFWPKTPGELPELAASLGKAGRGANDNCLSNVLVGYALLWEVRHAPTGEPS